MNTPGLEAPVHDTDDAQSKVVSSITGKHASDLATPEHIAPVSYTHLTLPTIYSV